VFGSPVIIKLLGTRIAAPTEKARFGCFPVASAKRKQPEKAVEATAESAKAMMGKLTSLYLTHVSVEQQNILPLARVVVFAQLVNPKVNKTLLAGVHEVRGCKFRFLCSRTPHNHRYSLHSGDGFPHEFP